MNTKEFTKKLMMLTFSLRADLNGLRVEPRNESLIKLLPLGDETKKLLREQSISNWEGLVNHIPTYEKSLQDLANTEINFGDEYLHNNLNKLLQNASDLRELYDQTISYLKKKGNPGIIDHTKEIVNELLEIVRGIVENDSLSEMLKK